MQEAYPVNRMNVDKDLVESLLHPSKHPHAAAVFYNIISKTGLSPSFYIDDMLEKLDCPLLLIWGMADPWFSEVIPDKIQSMYPHSQRVDVDAGHCPHDEQPQEVNRAIKDFMENTTTSPS